MAVTIIVDNEEALVDDVITIKVKGLSKNQPITVRAEVTEKNKLFGASACFTADDNGEVDLSRDASSSGTYTGVSAMGLFWSMRSRKPGIRLIKNNASLAMIVNLSVFIGHITFEELYSTPVQSLCDKTIRRWYMANGVQKVKIKTGRIRGMLFLPPGPGSFPGIIDMFGTVGSCVEFRAALLASRGFACLALPYFLYEDLPKNMEEVELEYFLEAVDWFSRHPSVIGDTLGCIGVSKGGEIAIFMGYYSDKVKSVVSINGAPFFTSVPMLYEGDYIGHSFYDPNAAVLTEEGFESLMVMDAEIEQYLPLWEKDVKTLIIGGLDDRALQHKIHSTFYELYPPDRKHLIQLQLYPGAGHLIEPPYSPLARSTSKHSRGVGGDYGMVTLLWGGQTVEHAAAQEDSWRRILEHFRTTLPTYSVKTDTGDPKSKMVNSRL